MTGKVACVIGVAAMLLAACSTSAPQAETPRTQPTPVAPPGFELFLGDGFALAYPSDWEELRGSQRFSAAVDTQLEVVGPVAESGLPPIAVVELPVIFSDNLRGAIGSRTGQMDENPDFDIVAETDLELPGAQRAVMFEIVYRQTMQDGEPVPNEIAPQNAERVEMHGFQIFAEDAAGRVMILSTGAVKAEFDRYEDQIATIIDSFTITSGTS